MSIKEFGSRLKLAREDFGISQRSLGLSIGLSDKTISSYESGRSYPNLEILKKIADVLEKPVDYFISSSNEDVLIKDLLGRIVRKQSDLVDEIKKLNEIINRGE
jgi:transcriptional regulator with XRE-family HTH domain